MEFIIFFGLAIIAVALIIYGLQGKINFTTVKKDLKTGSYIEVDKNGNPIHPDYIKIKTKIENTNNKSYSNKSYSIGFWHGHKGLALTFWGYFVGGNIIFNIITTILLNNPTIALLNVLISIVWTVLSTMGVFNAADIYKAVKIKQGLPYTAATIAKVACVLLILAGLGMNISRE
jgi:hypothetical protein